MIEMLLTLIARIAERLGLVPDPGNLQVQLTEAEVRADLGGLAPQA